MRHITITLTVQQAERVLDSLAAHLAGDTAEGDLGWTVQEHATAIRARRVILGALGSLSK